MANENGGLPPILVATLQSAAIAGVSNIMAQALMAHQADTSLVVDWVPVFQFVLYTFLNTPVNFLWGDFLEQTFPAYHAAPTNAAVEKASRSDDADKALDRADDEAALVEPRLNIANTLIKTVLDQTVGAAFNTFLFAFFINSLKAAMVRPEGMAAPEQSLAFLVSGSAVDYSRVDWSLILARVRIEFLPVIVAGWKLWPLVSLVNFAFIKTVQGRNLVASLAGVGWGIYISLISA